MITKEILEKCKKLYKNKYDVDLTNEQTTQLANDLVNLMRVLLKPAPKPVNNEVNPDERRKDETISTLQFQY